MQASRKAKGAVVGHDPGHGNAEAGAIVDCRSQEENGALAAFSSGSIWLKAMREASSIET